MSQQLWSQFIGFNPCEEGCEQLETSILSLTRLDAWFGTVIELLQPEDKRGGGRQRDYSLCFHKNHSIALFSITNKIYDFVNFWEPSELVVPSSEDDNPREAICSLQRTATIILEACTGSFFLAVKSDWFNQYISRGMGVVHDCYIAKISNDWTEIQRLDFDNQPNSSTVVNEPGTTGVLREPNTPRRNAMAHPSPSGLPDDETNYYEVEEGGEDMPAATTVPPVTS